MEKLIKSDSAYGAVSSDNLRKTKAMRGIREARLHNVVEPPQVEGVHAPMPPVPPRSGRKRVAQQPGLVQPGEFLEDKSDASSSSWASTHRHAEVGGSNMISMDGTLEDEMDYEVGRIVAKGVETQHGCEIHDSHTRSRRNTRVVAA